MKKFLFTMVTGTPTNLAVERDTRALYQEMGDHGSLFDELLIVSHAHHDNPSVATDHHDAARNAGLSTMHGRCLFTTGWNLKTTNGYRAVPGDDYRAEFYVDAISRVKAEAARLGVNCCIDNEPYGEQFKYLHGGYSEKGGARASLAVRRAVEVAGQVDLIINGPDKRLKPDTGAAHFGSAHIPIGKSVAVQAGYHWPAHEYPAQDDWHRPSYAGPLDDWVYGVWVSLDPEARAVTPTRKPMTPSEFMAYPWDSISDTHPNASGVMVYTDAIERASIIKAMLGAA